MKTECVLAFGQMPEEMQTPFKGLYPEIVEGTPVKIIVDPESRSLDFTVGAREMSFGPSNENYSVFLTGVYRLLFAAAQKAGWLSNFPVDAAQEDPEAQPVTEAPVAEAPAPPPPPPPAEEPKVASAAPGPWVVINEKTGKIVSEHKNKGEATKVYKKMNAEDGGFAMQAKSYWEENQPKKKKKAELDPAARLAILQTKVASMPPSPEVDALKAKIAVLVGTAKKASTDPSPKGADKLYVRPLDFVNNLREDWQSWAEKHGGEDSMHLQGTCDLLDTGKHTGSVEACTLAERSGWKEATTWTNPKGLQTADDSKLVAQLRKGSFKEACGDAPASESETKEASAAPKVAKVKKAGSLVEQVKAYAMQHYQEGWDNLVECWDDSDIQKNIGGVTTLQEAIAACADVLGLDVTPLQGRFLLTIRAEDGEHRKTFNDFASAQAAWNNYIKRPLRVTEEQLLAGKWDSEISDYGASIALEALHSGGGSSNDEPEFDQDFQDFRENDPSDNDLYRGTIASRKNAAEGDASQVLNHTDNPIEKLADGTQKGTEIKDETQVKEVATAKSASSLDFQLGQAAPVKTASDKTAYGSEVSAPISMFLRDYAGQTMPLAKVKELLHNNKEVLKELISGKFLKGNEQAVTVQNRDMLADAATATQRFAARKKARHSDAKPIYTTYATFPVKIDCPAGCTVTGEDPTGASWEQTQTVNYGEIIGSEGGDAEPIDVFLGPDTNSSWVFIINQTKKDGDQSVPDELKAGLGFWSLEDARDAYLSMFPEGWDQYDSNIVTASVDSFRDWMSSHPGATSVNADDFNLTTTTPTLVEPNPVSEVAAGAVSPYAASVTEIHSEDPADVFTSFHDSSARPLDHTAATLANLISTQVLDHTRGHVASLDAYTRPSLEDAVRVSVDTHKANLTPTHISASRIAEIITADLNSGVSPEDCDTKAASVGYYGADQLTYRRTLAKLAGIVGQLVLQPNFIKNSCVATHAALTGPHKATRNKTAYHSVASTSSCGDCAHCKGGSQGEKHCALFQRPIVASLEEMHKLADKVWGASKEAQTTTGLSRRAVAHLASLNRTSDSPLTPHTAAVVSVDVAESRPSPSPVGKIASEVNPEAYITASLSQGLTPSRITELVNRSTSHSASFKEAALKELTSQRGLVGFLTILPNFAGSCSITHGKHFSNTAKGKDKRKTAFHSVLKVAACNGCQNCVKSATAGERCSLYGKPLVATMTDLRKVASQAIPSLAPKIAAGTKEEMANAALPYLAKSLGLPEDHPSMQAFQVSKDPVANSTEGTDIDKLPPVEGEQGAVEGSSKNVMDLAMEAAKPKTKDLEDVTVKVKEAFTKGKTAQQVYDSVKGTMARNVGKVELQRIVRKVAGETFAQQSQSSSNDEVYTEVSTNDTTFGNMIKKLAEGEIEKERVSLNDNSVDLNEMAEMPTGAFNDIEGFVQ